MNKLETITDKTTHEVMVPFTKKAFMPGRLVHTNEILVLLGDNWFVERSAKQARFVPHSSRITEFSLTDCFSGKILVLVFFLLKQTLFLLMYPF
jgi:hypothetical protein